MTFDPILLEGLDFDFQDSWESQTVETGDVEYEWHADISTYPECDEIEMLYIFEDSDDTLFENISGVKSCYECKYTGDTILPLLDSTENHTQVVAYVPVPEDTGHDISRFPSQYLEELREDLYQQVIEPNL